MIINRLIGDIIQEKGKSISYVASRTGYPIERLDDIINCKSPVTPGEAFAILWSLGVNLCDYICTY